MPPIRNLIPPQYRSRLLRPIDPDLHDGNHLVRCDPKHLMTINTIDISLLVGRVAVEYGNKHALVMKEIRPAD